jgi:hypothetical protein
MSADAPTAAAPAQEAAPGDVGALDLDDQLVARPGCRVTEAELLVGGPVEQYEGPLVKRPRPALATLILADHLGVDADALAGLLPDDPGEGLGRGLQGEAPA